MKLIDILVQELPKRGGWPEDAAFVAQEEGGELWSFTSKPHKDCDDEWMDESSSGYHNKVGKLPEASDHDTSAITREQYEATLAAKNDGWIEWGGGECPVPCGAMVDVKHRCGAVSENQQSWPKGHKESDVIVNPLSNAGQAFWRHENSVMDIIAYRLHKPQEAEQAKADDEADLNECIGQDAAQAWSGEGQPPVGCECEVSVDGGRSWCTYKAINEKNGAQLIEIGNFTEEFQNNNLIFRHTRSEAERKRDEAVKTIMLTGWCQAAAEEIYDLVAAGKVPGMKLED